MKDTKKYISPDAWFSMEYPKAWYEFEDGEGSFLFYNPEKWNGNFRISAERGYSDHYGEEVLTEEARKYPNYKRIKLACGNALYNSFEFAEEESNFVSYHWLYAVKEMFFECTFTVIVGESNQIALDILNSIEVRALDKKYPAEIIPIRLSEIYRVDNDFEWVTNLIKDKYAIPFQGVEEDIVSLDKVKNDGLIASKKREQWQAVGITLASILANEVEGVEWYTLIDGNREDPVLYYLPNGKMIDPMKLVWSKIKSGEDFTIEGSYQEALSSLTEK